MVFLLQNLFDNLIQRCEKTEFTVNSQLRLVLMNFDCGGGGAYNSSGY